MEDKDTHDYDDPTETDEKELKALRKCIEDIWALYDAYQRAHRKLTGVSHKWLR